MLLAKFGTSDVYHLEMKCFFCENISIPLTWMTVAAKCENNTCFQIGFVIGIANRVCGFRQNPIKVIYTSFWPFARHTASRYLYFPTIKTHGQSPRSRSFTDSDMSSIAFGAIHTKIKGTSTPLQAILPSGQNWLKRPFILDRSIAKPYIHWKVMVLRWHQRGVGEAACSMCSRSPLPAL